MTMTSSPPEDTQYSTRYTDVCQEPVARHLLPIKGYQTAPDVSLEKAIESISQFFVEIETNAWIAKQNCLEPEEGLTPDESASIHLYTMEFVDGPSLFYVLNQALRAEDRQKLKLWFPFLKLFLTGLYKLPSLSETIFRGVQGVDLSSKYPNGKRFTWWGVSSCTRNMTALDKFTGTTGIRTIFIIECQNGKSVALHSYYKDKEAEIILMPGSYFEVRSQHSPAPGLHQIHLKEIDSPFPLVKPPYVKTEVFISFAQSNPSEMTNTISTSMGPSSAVHILSSQITPSDVDSSKMIKSFATNYKPFATNYYIPKINKQAAIETAAQYSANENFDIGHISSSDQLKVLKCDMPQSKQDLIVSIVISNIERADSNNDIAERIVRSLDKHLKQKYYCIVGDSFSGYIAYETTCFMFLKYNTKIALIWKCDENSVGVHSYSVSYP